MEFKTLSGRVFSEQQAIDLLVSLTASDANSEKKWRGFYNSLSPAELQQEWNDHWSSNWTVAMAAPVDWRSSPGFSARAYNNIPDNQQ